jgi:hypothetical protein
MITRKDYLEGRATHHEYYMDVLNAMAFKPHLPVSVEVIREKLKTDDALNNIPLIQWDCCTVTGANEVLKERGDYLTAAGKVCILKAWAKHLAEQVSA